MIHFKLLTPEEVNEMIANDLLDIHESEHIRLTPKKWVVICPERIYASNDLNLTLKRIKKDYPKIKVSDISYINANTYKESLI